MLWFLIPALILLACGAGAVAIVVRKFPELVLIDVTTIARERDAQIKRGIMTRRARRLSQAWLSQARGAVAPVGGVLLGQLKRWYARAAELEQKHRKIGMASGSGEKVLSERHIRELMDEADALLKAGKTNDAEAKYIEVVSMSPKYVKAYEALGRLYLHERQWKEAHETFSFLLKLDSKDASVLANLGELETARGNLTQAIVHYRAAVDLKPANPKYLDLLLEAGIGAGERDLARATFARLKETNPENQKLPDFESRIREMVAQTKKAKTQTPT